jgi:hypothetical protein
MEVVKWKELTEDECYVHSTWDIWKVTKSNRVARLLYTWQRKSLKERIDGLPLLLG